MGTCQCLTKDHPGDELKLSKNLTYIIENINLTFIARTEDEIMKEQVYIKQISLSDNGKCYFNFSKLTLERFLDIFRRKELQYEQ